MQREFSGRGAAPGERERSRRQAIAADLRYSADPIAFAVERLGWTPDPWQGDLLTSSGNVLLNCSRQSGKSTTTSVLALHTALYEPGALVLLVSPTMRQSRELFHPPAFVLHLSAAICGSGHGPCD